MNINSSENKYCKAIIRWIKLQDTEDPHCETGHNALFIGPDGNIWSSCHYKGYGKSLYPYCPELQDWEKTPQIGIEPVYYKNGRFYILKPTWTEQVIEY
ncbi:hypothetical protein [Labilibaculum euxinus]